MLISAQQMRFASWSLRFLEIIGWDFFDVGRFVFWPVMTKLKVIVSIVIQITVHTLSY